MKIYQINCSSYGSTGKLALDIHKRLVEEGYESRFGYGYGNCNINGAFKISNWFDRRLHDKLSQLTGLIGWFSVLCTIRLLHDIRKFNPDIVHLHNIHGNYLNLPLLFSYFKKSSIKVLFTLHDCWAFTGKCPHFTLAGCNKWHDVCFKCPQLNSFPCSKIFDTSKLLFNQKKRMFLPLQNMRISTVSEWLSNMAKLSFLGIKQIDVVPNGINTSIFRIKRVDLLKAKLDLDKKFVILGVASSWNNRKGLDKWIEIRNVLDDNYNIILIGLRKTQVSELPHGIIGIENTENQEQLVDYYNIADVFVNMSKEETFGLVTVEAMACGTPAIVFNSTANPELVSIDRGIVIDSTDILEIKKGIEHIQAIGKINYSMNCRAFVEKGYTIDIMYNNYRRLYNEIML